jgi:hypothetical protein
VRVAIRNGTGRTVRRRTTCKLFALQALQGEPRVSVRSIDVVTDRSKPTLIEVRAHLKVAGFTEPISIATPLDLAGGVA